MTIIWIIVGLVILVLVLLLLFWLVDNMANRTVKQKVVKNIVEVKEEPEKVTVNSTKIEVNNTTLESNQTTTTVTAAPQVEQEKETQPTQSRYARGRIRDYYNDRWGDRNPNAFDGFKNTDNQSADSNVYLTQEDVKKLVTLSDLFDKK